MQSLIPAPVAVELAISFQAPSSEPRPMTSTLSRSLKTSRPFSGFLPRFCAVAGPGDPPREAGFVEVERLGESDLCVVADALAGFGFGFLDADASEGTTTLLRGGNWEDFG